MLYVLARPVLDWSSCFRCFPRYIHVLSSIVSSNFRIAGIPKRREDCMVFSWAIVEQNRIWLATGRLLCDATEHMFKFEFCMVNYAGKHHTLSMVSPKSLKIRTANRKLLQLSLFSASWVYITKQNIKSKLWIW